MVEGARGTGREAARGGARRGDGGKWQSHRPQCGVLAARNSLRGAGERLPGYTYVHFVEGVCFLFSFLDRNSMREAGRRFRSGKAGGLAVA